MKKRFMYPLSGALLALFAVSAVGAEKSDVDAKALFEQNCSTCHSIERPMSKRKPAKEWESTVERMRLLNGARITDEQAAAIIGYLSKNYGE